MNFFTISRFNAAVDDRPIRAIATEDQQNVLREPDRAHHHSPGLLHRATEREREEELALDDEHLLAREFSAGCGHRFASTMEARVVSARCMQGHARILFCQVSAFGDCDIFRNRTSHARASRRSAATVVSGMKPDPAAFMEAVVVTLPTRTIKIKNFFMR
jgi:hypothetical protein